jgi:hypothetical protein
MKCAFSEMRDKWVAELIVLGEIYMCLAWIRNHLYYSIENIHRGVGIPTRNLANPATIRHNIIQTVQNAGMDQNGV